METKACCGGTDSREAIVGNELVIGDAQGSVDHIEVGREILWRLVGFMYLKPCSLHRVRPYELSHCCHDAAANTVNSASIWFVRATWHIVMSLGGEFHQLNGHLRMPVRQTQFVFQGMQLARVVFQHDFGSASGGVSQGFGRDIGVPVMVAPDPGTRFNHGDVGNVSSET